MKATRWSLARSDQVLLRMLDDVFLQFLGISSAEAIDLLALLDEDEGGHGRDVVAHCELLAVVDVDLKGINC